jgi:hypothetical protein
MATRKKKNETPALAFQVDLNEIPQGIITHENNHAGWQKPVSQIGYGAYTKGKTKTVDGHELKYPFGSLNPLRRIGKRFFKEPLPGMVTTGGNLYEDGIVQLDGGKLQRCKEGHPGGMWAEGDYFVWYPRQVNDDIRPEHMKWDRVMPTEGFATQEQADKLGCPLNLDFAEIHQLALKYIRLVKMQWDLGSHDKTQPLKGTMTKEDLTTFIKCFRDAEGHLSGTWLLEDPNVPGTYWGIHSNMTVTEWWDLSCWANQEATLLGFSYFDGQEETFMAELHVPGVEPVRLPEVDLPDEVG